jgi:hypothetical protein
VNPKDMTNMQLVEAIKDQRFSLVDETKELLRRLNERDQYKIQWENCNSDFHFAVEQADALRKENKELRKESFALYARLNEYSYQFIYGGRSGVRTAYVLAAPVLASYRLSHPDGFDAKEIEARS